MQFQFRDPASSILRIAYRRRGLILAIVALAMPACTFGAAEDAEVGRTSAALQMSTLTYQGNNAVLGANQDACGTTRYIRVAAPDAAGTYPVAVYFAGTLENYLSDGATYMRDQLATRGFVAANVEYNNGWQDPACDMIQKKARCALSTTYNPQSAIAAVCAHPKADCSKGIVTIGFSQGGVIALQGKNHDIRVRATWAIGSAGYPSYESCGAASPYGSRALANDRVRFTQGINDQFCTQVAVMNRMSGQACVVNNNCLRANGSGWYRVPVNELENGNAAGHEYWALNTTTTSYGGPVDWYFKNTLYPGSITPNINFLKSFVTP